MKSLLSMFMRYSHHLGVVCYYDLPRPAVLFARSHFSDTPVNCIEVGVYKGANAQSIYTTLEIESLALVDDYKQHHVDGTDIKAAQDTARNLFFSKEKVKVHILSSLEAVPLFEKESIDFIYIDADHAYTSVKRDISDYWPKIRRNGILAGHDLENEDVRRAVMEFCKEQHLQYHAAKQDWWIIKETTTQRNHNDKSENNGDIRKREGHEQVQKDN